MEVRFMKLDEVKRATSLSRAGIYQMIQKGQFPRQCRIGERSVAWISTEVAEWIDSTIRANRAL